MSGKPRNNVWLWVSIGILSGSLALGAYYYYRQQREWKRKQEEREREIREYVLSAIRFREEDFAYMSGLIDQCRKLNKTLDEQNGCIYKQLEIYINQVKKGTQIADWEKEDIRKFVNFLKQKGLGDYTAQYEIYLQNS